LAEPAQELLQVVTIAAHSRGREILAPQTAHENRQASDPVISAPLAEL
jgi:hypothetical protein